MSLRAEMRLYSCQTSSSKRIHDQSRRFSATEIGHQSIALSRPSASSVGRIYVLQAIGFFPDES